MNFSEEAKNFSATNASVFLHYMPLILAFSGSAL